MSIEMLDLTPPGRLVDFLVLDMLALNSCSEGRGFDV
jgi:hypothetical protein